MRARSASRSVLSWTRPRASRSARRSTSVIVSHRRQCAGHAARVLILRRDALYQRGQDVLDRAELTGVAQQRGDARVEIERHADLLRVVAAGVVEAVDGDNERQ